MIKIAVLVAFCVWLSERPGSVEVSWMEYNFTVQLGFFLILSLFAIVVAMTLFSVIKSALDAPATLKKRQARIRKEKGYKALTQGLAAVAAGDSNAAQKLAHRAQKYLPDDHGLPVLLGAQSARMTGDEESAKAHFEVLMDNKDTAFFGVRGLMQSALNDNDTEEALALAHEAKSLYPKQNWTQTMIYDLELQNREWENALNTLRGIEKTAKKKTSDLQGFSKHRIISDKIALYHAMADRDVKDGFEDHALAKREKAYKFDKFFAPNVTRLTASYLALGKTRKAKNLITRVWKIEPHSDYLAIWDDLHQASESDPIAHVKIYETLVKLNPNSALSHIALARATLCAGLWGETKAALKTAETLSPSSEVFAIQADLERKTTNNQTIIAELEDRASNAAAENRWVCRQTGRIYDTWSPVALPHRAFNTIEWSAPHIILSRAVMNDQMALDDPSTFAVLDSPKIIGE
jgi:HemY protein